jgi:pimeloyl-ACP methyl ester carboxylesterase
MRDAVNHVNSAPANQVGTLTGAAGNQRGEDAANGTDDGRRADPSFPRAWHQHVDVVQGLDALSWSAGKGDPIVLIHGIGPGTCGAANFAPIMQQLAASYEVHVLDLIGFGGSERKVSLPYFDVTLWLDQIAVLLARIGRPAILIGNSVGGALAFKTAAANHCVKAVASIASPLRASQPTPALVRFWQTPADEAALALAMQPMTASDRVPNEDLVNARFATFAKNDGYGAYFAEMLSDPIGALQSAGLTDDEVAQIACPTLVMHGMVDRACSMEETAMAFVKMRPDVDAVLFGNCGHNIAWERGSDLLEAINAFLRRLRA